MLSQQRWSGPGVARSVRVSLRSIQSDLRRDSGLHARDRLQPDAATAKRRVHVVLVDRRRSDATGGAAGKRAWKSPVLADGGAASLEGCQQARAADQRQHAEFSRLTAT